MKILHCKKKDLFFLNGPLKSLFFTHMSFLSLFDFGLKYDPDMLLAEFVHYIIITWDCVLQWFF